MQKIQQNTIAVAMVCDFYYPQLGGVQLQIKSLSKYIKNKIDKVIIITHCRPQYYGQKQIQGIKTYYLPRFYSESNVIYPTFFLEYPQAKKILLRQKINIVHVHQSSSTLGVCYAIFGYYLNLKVIQTEHSLYGYTSFIDMNFNWAMTSVYELYDRFICVSRATRNNFIMRCHVNSEKIIIIPNAVEKDLTIIKNNQKTDVILKIAIVSRMAYRRGIDLLIELIPIFCKRNQQICFEIIGDGPKLNPLKEIIIKQNLQSMVNLHGKMQNKQALQIVKSCHIYLSTALTESFGIAIIQASYLGLQCISTNVGGVSEILPHEKLKTVSLQVSEIVQQLQSSISRIRQNNHQKDRFIQEQTYYDKQDCFNQVIEVYKECLQQKCQSKNKLKKVIKQITSNGSLPGILLIIILFLIKILDSFLEIFAKNKRFNE